MTIRDEELMAYADGELAAADRARVAAAIAQDPELAQRVAQHAALRSRLQRSFAPTLDEAVPDRFLALLGERAGTAAPAEESAPPGQEPPRDELAAARERRRARSFAADWRGWAALAAGVLLGIALDRGALPAGMRGPVGPVEGIPVAQGLLERSLSHGLAAEQPPDAPVQLGPSLVEADGTHCRSFVMPEAGRAGLACRRAENWQLDLLAPLDVQTAAGEYRPAGSALPLALLQAIDQRSGARVLDADEERAARERGWR